MSPRKYKAEATIDPELYMMDEWLTEQGYTYNNYPISIENFNDWKVQGRGTRGVGQDIEVKSPAVRSLA